MDKSGFTGAAVSAKRLHASNDHRLMTSGLCSSLRLHFTQLSSRGLQPLDDHGAHALKEFVAKVMVFLALLAQTSAVEKDCFGRLYGAGVEMPVVRRK